MSKSEFKAAHPLGTAFEESCLCIHLFFALIFLGFVDFQSKIDWNNSERYIVLIFRCTPDSSILFSSPFSFSR
jgi:hypothetical protein